MSNSDGASAASDPQQQLFRLLLRVSRPGIVIQDRIDCADFARKMELHDEAAMLLGSARLQIGFSSAASAWLAGPSSDGSLLYAPLAGSASSGAAADVIDAAIADLRWLMEAVPLQSLPCAPSANVGAVAAPQPTCAMVMGLANHARSFLIRISEGMEASHMKAELLEMAADLIILETVRLEEHLNASYAEKSALFALEQVRQFVAANLELLDTEADSYLFECAAKLSPASLGPYFTNVWRLVRSARDIPALIEAATRGTAASDQLSIWCVLLSTHLREHEVSDLVEELSGRGLLAAVRALLERIERIARPGQWHDVVRTIRDVAIDIGEFEMATSAQRLLAAWRPNHAESWEMLGEISASAGDSEAAVDAFASALMLDPSNHDLLEKLDVFRAGFLPPMQCGYSSSIGRARLRRARYLKSRTYFSGSPA